MPEPLPAPLILPSVDMTKTQPHVISLGATSSGGDNAWIYPSSFNSNWATRSGNPFRYRKTADGMVCIAGCLYATSLTHATYPYIMPAGYRPGGDPSSGSVLDVPEFMVYRFSASSGVDKVSIRMNGEIGMPALNANEGCEFSNIQYYAEN